MSGRVMGLGSGVIGFITKRMKSYHFPSQLDSLAVLVHLSLAAGEIQQQVDLELLKHLLMMSQVLVGDPLDSIAVAVRRFTKLALLIQGVAIL